MATPQIGTPEYTNYLLGGDYFSSTGAVIKPFTQADAIANAKNYTASPPTIQTTTAPVTSINTNTAAPYTPTPEDQQLLAMGITPQQLQQMNTPEGLDPVSFQSLIGNVENKLKTNNELVTQRGYLIKQLYDNPLTSEQLKALPEDIQRVVASGDKDTIELQLRLMNDQIAGRANTLSQSIGYLADAYQTGVEQIEKQRNQAIDTVIDFVGQYGSKAPQVLASLYGPAYLDKLKAMGIDIESMASVSTIAQDKAAADAAAKAVGDDTIGGNYSDIINTILSSGKFTKEQSLAIARAINNGEDPLTVVRNNAKNIMTGANATKLESYENTKYATEALDKSFKDFYAAGGSTNIFKGNFEKVLNNLGAVNDPKLVGLATEVASNLQIYRNAISGTAYSEQEGKDILTIFPGITKGEILNNTIVQARIKSLDTMINGIYTNTLGSAYTALKTASAGTSPAVVPSPTTVTAPVVETPVTKGFWGSIINWLSN